MFVNFNILNQLGSPAINSNTFANRPAAGQTGRLFVSTDTYEIYRDNGTSWDLIGGPGSSTITGTGTATQVAYFTSSQAIGSSANLFWDNTSGFLGVATATPTARIEAVKTDGIGIYANYTTNAGSGSSATAIWAKNVTNSSGFAAVIEETTPNATAGQYPLLIKHSLSSGTAGVGMGTGLHFQLPDDAGTFKTTQLTIETINAAAATYATRYRFNVQSNGSSTPVAYINATGLGIFTATPSAALDIHSTGIMAQLNSTSATANSLLAFQRSGSGLWRIGDNYGGGTNYFELFNTVLGINAMQVFAATNKTSWQATETYTTGQARANYFDYNLSVAAGGSFSSPNAITALGASLDLTLAGNATIPSGARSGLDAYNSIAFTGAGTLTHNQGTQIRAYSNVTAGWAFNGSAVGTITHLAGLRALFPDNSGSAVNVTNNYALLLNDQTANTGTVTYTNRWGVYQEGASDLNYMAANLLLGSTTNSGQKLQVTGTSNLNGTTTITSSATNTGGLIVTGGSNVGSPFASSAQIFIGPGGNRGSLSWDDNIGYLYIDNTYNNAAANIYIRTRTNGTPVNLITGLGSGLVGINTTAPTRTLDVDGVIRTRNSGSAGAPSIELGTSAQGNGIFYPATNTLAFATNDTERVRITSAGDVQFNSGTGANLAPIQTGVNIFGGATSASTQPGVLTIGANNIAVSQGTAIGILQFYSNDSSALASGVRGYISSVADNAFGQNYALTFGTGASATATEKMRINSNGDLGIGTINPQFKLDVEITAGPYISRFRNSSTSTSEYNAILISQGAAGSATGYLGTGGSAVSNAAFANNFVIGTQSNNAFVFSTNDSEKARFTAGGNFLIGTTTDNSYKLVSNGNTYGGNTLEVSPGYGNTTGQLTFGVATWSNVSSYTIDLSTTLPRANFTSLGLFVVLNILTQSNSTNSSIATVQAVRTQAGTWTFNSLGALGSITMTYSGSGTSITITFSGGSQFGKAAIQFINQG